LETLEEKGGMQKEKLLGIQYLRAGAALMVAYYHLQSQIPAFTRALSFDRIVNSAHLSSGVYVFFVISGFIMYVTGRNLGAGEFVRRRLVRILPLYWSVTLAVSVIAILAPHAVHRTDVTAEYVAKSMLFVPYANPTQHALLFPILVPGWSLNYEMAFYALFAVGLLAPPRWRMAIVGGTLGTCVIAGFLRSRPEMLSVWGFYTSSRLLLFAAGIGLGMIYGRLRPRSAPTVMLDAPWAAADGIYWLQTDDGSRWRGRCQKASAVATDARPQLPRWVCATLVLVGLWMILGDFGTFTRSVQSLGSVEIVAGAVAWEYQYGFPRWRALLLLGDASYSIYLIHIFAFGITRQVWWHLHGYAAAQPALFAAFSMLVAVGLGLLTYGSIERPALAILSRPRRVSAAQESVYNRPVASSDVGSAQ
jgi:exopolysaccharide production protein ExoZ